MLLNKVRRTLIWLLCSHPQPFLRSHCLCQIAHLWTSSPVGEHPSQRKIPHPSFGCGTLQLYNSLYLLECDVPRRPCNILHNSEEIICDFYQSKPDSCQSSWAIVAHPVLVVTWPQTNTYSVSSEDQWFTSGTVPSWTSLWLWLYHTKTIKNPCEVWETSDSHNCSQLSILVAASRSYSKQTLVSQPTRLLLVNQPDSC